MPGLGWSNGPVRAPSRPRPSSPKATTQTAQPGRKQADRPSPHALRFCRREPSNPASRRIQPPIARGGRAPTSHPDRSGPTTIAPGSQPQPELRPAPVYDPSKTSPSTSPLNHSSTEIEMISSQALSQGRRPKSRGLAGSPDKTPRCDGSHQQRDQHIVAGQ